jgi:Mg-chelatase subunit ChlD
VCEKAFIADPRRAAILSVMNTPFGLVAACEAKNVEAGTSTLWASIKIEPRGNALEKERAPLAVALVIDTSGSMQGDPIQHVLRSC